MQKIPIQTVLRNVGAELFDLSNRLKRLEAALFTPGHTAATGPPRQHIQDMDLVIQQLADLGRATHYVAGRDLDDLAMGAEGLDDVLHLDDLRQRLLGRSDPRMTETGTQPHDIIIF